MTLLKRLDFQDVVATWTRRLVNQHSLLAQANRHWNQPLTTFNYGKQAALRGQCAGTIAQLPARPSTTLFLARPTAAKGFFQKPWESKQAVTIARQPQKPLQVFRGQDRFLALQLIAWNLNVFSRDLRSKPCPGHAPANAQAEAARRSSTSHGGGGSTSFASWQPGHLFYRFEEVVLTKAARSRISNASNESACGEANA